MKVALIEPFFTGSHRQWAKGLQKYSNHEIDLLTLKGRHWKWRMHGGAVTLARQFGEKQLRPDLLLVTDMLDLTTFLSLTRPMTAGIPAVIYMHENQLSYPWSPTDTDKDLDRDMGYGFINYTSCLAADHVLFNSDYHKTSFLSSLKELLHRFPDHNEHDNVEAIARKSTVLQPGLEPDLFSPPRYEKPVNKVPVILWNHRWEYDKGPEDFFAVLSRAQDLGLEFQLIVAGENYRKHPPIFREAREQFTGELIHFGYAESRESYLNLLNQADILPITSRQEFFGISAAEAIVSGCFPLLPDRLAFPELVAKAQWNQVGFKDNDDLFSRLCTLISSFRESRNEDYSEHLKPLNWQVHYAAYDELFKDVLLNSPKA